MARGKGPLVEGGGGPPKGHLGPDPHLGALDIVAEIFTNFFCSRVCLGCDPNGLLANRS